MMSIPVFPDFLIPLLDGFSETVEPVILRSEFESGPARQRSFQCGQMVRRSITYTVCGCENMDLFRDWFIMDLRNGSSWFKWQETCSGEFIRARCVDGTYTAAPTNSNFDSWDIGLNIEYWRSNA